MKAIYYQDSVDVHGQLIINMMICHYITLIKLMIIFSQYPPCLSRSHHNKSRQGTTSQCQEPDLNEVHQSLPSDLHDSFSLIKPFVGSVVTLSDVPRQYVNILIKTLDDTRSCAVLQNLAKREAGPMCPTYHVLNFDENRKPKSLVETRCSCKNCPDPNVPHKTSTLLACQPIIYYTRVLRRFDCRDGIYVYQTSWEPLQVGCTCNFPQFRRSSNTI
ncbi:uncharacterized protein LOC121366260 [Gigantopelta aegis]|uniref:uncharacterized protein LOC121366260 n=1 Tax=Gigantopelta aegis TaxID=1735272 RepID=UPI001B88D7DE|nr:uncharacterized protein LOC121366260 [Gigantopelta aegis]